MPRRKRNNSTEKKKPPLQFQESPYTGLRKPPSPVFCSDNPATAEVIPVNESLVIPWVSPQFPRVPTTIGKAKGARRSKRIAKEALGASSISSVVTPTHKTKHKINSKVVPLKFVGDKSITPPSPVEDISYIESFLDPPESHSERLQADRHRKQLQDKTSEQLRKPQSSLSSCPDCLAKKIIPCLHFEARSFSMGENVEDVDSDLPVLRTKTGRKNKPKRKKKPDFLKAKLENLFSSDSEMSVLEDETKAKKERQMLSLSSGDVTVLENVGKSKKDLSNSRLSSMENLSQILHLPVTPVVATCVRTGKNESTVCKNVSGDENNSSAKSANEFTSNSDHDTNSNKLPTVTLLGKDLFKNNNNDDKNVSSDSDTEKLSDLGDNNIGVIPEGTRLSPGLNRSYGLHTSFCTPKTALGNRSQTRNEQMGSYITPDRKRRSMRVATNFLFPSTPVNIHRDQLRTSNKVLVYDTPEEEYDLSVRQRMLKRLKPLHRHRLKDI